MRRWIAILWHASFLVLAGGLYFFFVLPRWYELTGEWDSTLGTAMRILCAVLIGLAALPVVFTWLRSRKPEYGTPQLALTLRVGSIALHVLAALLIAGAAVSEIWLSLDEVGQWLFGVYGAAAAVALLGALAFYLAYLAELPPPPPKPLKTKTKASSRGRGRGKAAAATETTEVTDSADAPADGTDPDASDDVPADGDATEDDATEVTAETDESAETAPVADGNAEEVESDKDSGGSGGRLRNRRTTGKPSSGLFRRNRGGVALDD
jgi:hypothetical protein